MPVTTSKNPLFAKALKAHAKDETDYGRDMSSPPAGITGGLARLVEAKRSKYAKGPNQGKDFLYLAGVILEPKTATEVLKVWDPDLNNRKGGVRSSLPKEVNVEGRRTSIMIPLCDTKAGDGKITAGEDHIAKALNELRKLGGEECTANLSTEDDFDNLLAALKEAGPVFKFSTSDRMPNAQYPNAGVWENWNGTKDVDYQTNPSANGHVQDSTGGGTTTEEAEPPADEVSLADLAEAADSKDEDAMAALKAKAEEAGLTEEDIDNAANWAAVAELIENGKPPEEEAAPEEVVPSKGDVFKYAPLDKTGKKRGKPVEVEVLLVDKKTSSCTVKNLDDGKSQYKAVKFAELIVV